MKTTLITIIILGFFGFAFAQNELNLPDIDSLLKSRYKQDEPGVSVLIARNNEILLRKSYGMASIELNVPMSPVHVFKIASITKPFTALAIFDLIANNKLNLNDSIIKYLPQLDPKYSYVQVRHLLSHTSGIIDFSRTNEFITLYSKYYFNFVNEEISGDSIFSIINKYDLLFNPGEQFDYCNSGYFFLERIIENISGLTFELYLKTKFFDPIKMNNTGIYGVTRIIKNRVPGYTDIDSEVVNNPHVYLEGILTKGNGGMVSCVDDLFLWYKAIMYDEYYYSISSEFFNNPYVLNDSSESVYSMGFFTKKLKNRKMLNHNGDASGFSSSLLILPDDDLFVVILGNSDLFSQGSSKYHEITAKRIAANLLNDPFPDYKTITLSDESMKKFEGVYVTENEVERRVLFENGNLYTQRKNGRKVRIYPYATNKFYYEGYLIDISFNMNESGSIISLTMNYDDGRTIIAHKISDDNKQ